MENIVKIIGDDNEALVVSAFEKNNIKLPSEEEHLNPENEILSENCNSNKANLGSDSPVTENLSTGLPILRSQSLQSIASSTVDPTDNNRSRSYVDLHRIGDDDDDDDAADFLMKRHDSDSEGSYERGSPERVLGLYGTSSPENESGSYNIHSPEPPIDEYITEKLDREIIEEEEDDNIKRIRNWIDQIDLSCNVVEDLGESSEIGSINEPIYDRMSSVQNARGPSDPKASVGMAMAYNYISAMNPVTASAQLSNLGLVAVPILSAFAGLKELNLSGNNIFQITAGAIPKGLHVLNLSKNYIAVIEGLKDLTKLRVLDLSHNRISRIGHGLAACTSLRELYLSSNKISEVEGLHRLLKLKILDLRNNRLSTARGLEQLAANYTSLEAISLDGNPAQRHVGDDHLKKYLRTLLPNLLYYNRHSARSRGKKDGIMMPGNNSSRSLSLRSRTGNRSAANLLKGLRNRNSQVASSSGLRPVSGLNPLRRIQSEGAMGD